MIDPKRVPVWARPIELDGWPTQQVSSDELFYEVALPQGWGNSPQVEDGPIEVAHIYKGGNPAELLTVSYMQDANPDSDMMLWVGAIVGMTGFPIPQMTDSGSEPPELLEWDYQGTSEPLAKRLSVDELHLYSGLARLSNGTPGLARFYILMARRGRSAWKVALSFASACVPGMPEEMVVSNDHVRAGATFGELKFL